jgi:hypothetical protein
MKHVDKKNISELWEMSHNMYYDMVKAVVDVKQRFVVVRRLRG